MDLLAYFINTVKVLPGKPQLPTCSSDKLGEVQNCICPRVSVFALLSVPPM